MSCNEWKESVLKDVIEFNPKETIKKGTLSKKVVKCTDRKSVV